jgi:type II secretory pathway pseudopilin PulG
MKFASTGTPAASRSMSVEASLVDEGEGGAGFTLLEALVALALVLTFAAALGPHLFQARRIVGGAEGRLAAQVLLRSLLDAPFDRTSLATAVREGEAGALRWRLTATPVVSGVPGGPHPTWTPVRVAASVSWAPGQSINAETMRLARTE